MKIKVGCLLVEVDLVPDNYGCQLVVGGNTIAALDVSSSNELRLLVYGENDDDLVIHDVKLGECG